MKFVKLDLRSFTFVYGSFIALSKVTLVLNIKVI